MSRAEQGPIRYDRDRLVEVLVYHQRASIERCACGWGELGHSHADHVAEVYEDCMRAADA